MKMGFGIVGLRNDLSYFIYPENENLGLFHLIMLHQRNSPDHRPSDLSFQEDFLNNPQLKLDKHPS